MHPSVPDTAKVASTTPSWGRKKNVMPRLACAAVSDCGSVGLSSDVPRAVDVKMCAAWLTWIVDVTASPELARSGVLKYSYPGIVSCSTYSPFAPVSKSYTVIATSAADGSTIGAAISSHAYDRRSSSARSAEHANGEYTSAP